MSTWLDLLNDVKRYRSAELLTPAQAQGYQRLCQMMTLPDLINLCGPHGAGKTFLAWQVARATGATYLPLPTQLDELDHTPLAVIVDNAPYQEREVRRLLSRCDLLGVPTVLFITHLKASPPMPTIELPLPTREDVEQVGRWISRLGYFFQAERLPQNPGFWDVLMASV